MLATYEGGCHCGQVRFRVQGDLDDVSVCNCSICTMKGIVHMVVPREQFELLRGEDAIATYRVRHRCREAHVLPALRHPLVLYAAVEAGRHQRERALPGRCGYRGPSPEPVRRTALGGVHGRSPRRRGGMTRVKDQPVVARGAKRSRHKLGGDCPVASLLAMRSSSGVQPRDVVADDLAAHGRGERGEVLRQHRDARPAIASSDADSPSPT